MSTQVATPETLTGSSVEAVMQALVDSWNCHDMATYAAQFLPDADFVNVLGERYQGREAIELQHVRIHKTLMRNSQIWTTNQSVRYLTPEVALAHVNWEMRGHQPPPEWRLPEVRRGVLTFVLARQNSQWKIAAGQNTDCISVSIPT